MKWEIDVAIPIEVPNASFLCNEVEKKIVRQLQYSSDASKRSDWQEAIPFAELLAEKYLC